MTYRDVVSRQVLTWACTALGARMPVAMAPLALVFLVRERPGGYSLGAVLAAAYVLGEIGGAPVLGMRLRPERARVQLAVGLAVGTVGFLGLGVFPGAHPAVLAGFAFVAGGAPAAATGGLRTLLGELVPARAAAQAMSVELGGRCLRQGWRGWRGAVKRCAEPRILLSGRRAVLFAWELGGCWFVGGCGCVVAGRAVPRAPQRNRPFRRSAASAGPVPY